MRLTDHLHRHARIHPEQTALTCNGTMMTYRQLSEAVASQADNYREGEAVVFRASQTADFVITYLAVHQAGAIAVPLERDLPEARFRETAASLADIRIPDGTADILYTTGTTGQSKGVMVSHQAIQVDAANLIEGQLYDSDLTFVIHGPLNHIGSLSKLWPLLVVGGSVHILDGQKDTEAFFSALGGQAPKTATFLVPAQVRMLLQLAPERLAACASRVDFFESGAAPLPHADMLRLCELLPDSRLYNTYASTEAGIIATYNYNDGRCLSGCLGRPLGRSRIVVGDGGRIVCQGPTLMTGYAGDPALTATVLHDGSLITSDIGRLDDEGMLRLEGRESDVINVGGYKVAPAEVEEAALSLSGVADCICIAVAHPITGQALKLLVVMASGATLNKRLLARHLDSRLERYKVPLLYEQTDTIRRTYNGKPDRRYYRQAAP